MKKQLTNEEMYMVVPNGKTKKFDIIDNMTGERIYSTPSMAEASVYAGEQNEARLQLKK